MLSAVSRTTTPPQSVTIRRSTHGPRRCGSTTTLSPSSNRSSAITIATESCNRKAPDFGPRLFRGVPVAAVALFKRRDKRRDKEADMATERVDERPDGSGFDTASLSENWSMVALRGAADIIFGILALALPGITLLALVFLFGSYAIVDGVLNIAAAVRGRRGRGPWWLLLIEGLVSIAAGVAAFVLPGLTALLLVYIIGAWAIVTGVLEIVAAVRLRREIRNEWWLILGGVLSVVFGALVMYAPGAGAMAIVLWIGAYAIVFGALLLGLAFRLRSWRSDHERAAMPRAA